MILLAFATYSSGTDLASQLATNVLKKSGQEVLRKEIREVADDDINKADLIIFASPSWRTRKGDGQPHEFFLDFIDRMEGKKFVDKKFAIMGLGDTAYTHFCGAVDVLEGFVNGLGGKLVHSSLRIDGFYFNQVENELLIREWSSNVNSAL